MAAKLRFETSTRCASRGFGRGTLAILGLTALVLAVSPGTVPAREAATTAPVPNECRDPNLSAAEQARCDFIASTPDLCLRSGLSEETQWFCDELAEPLDENTIGGVLEPRDFPPPGRTAWRPVGERGIYLEDDPVLGAHTTWRAMHANESMSDEVTGVAAPMFRLSWIADRDLFVPFAVAVDRDNTVWASPMWGPDRIMLIAYDSETGDRRLVVASDTPAGGCCNGPLLLEDPQYPGRQVVFAVDRGEAVAVDTGGELLWRSASGLVGPDLNEPTLGEYLGWGPNYNPVADAIVMVSGDGYIVLWDRITGQLLLEEPFKLPGAPSPRLEPLVPDEVQKVVDTELLPLVPGRPEGTGFADFYNTVRGGDVQVANHFPVDPRSGRMFIAATAPDEADGTADGVSEFGALYGVDVVRDDGGLELKIACRADFEGGSSATPSLNGAGERVYTADGRGNLLAFDRDCNPLWELDLGANVRGSPAVARDNNEIYAIGDPAGVPKTIQVFDRGDRGEIGWTSDLDAYPVAPNPLDFDLFNSELFTSAVAANGIMTQVGAGGLLPLPNEGTIPLPLNVGVALLDRDTGRMRFFAEGGEESIGVAVVAPDGALYTQGSPLRRVYARGLTPDATTAPLLGGITKFEPVRRDLLIRDATCAGADRAARARSIRQVQPEGTRADIRDIHHLVDQALEAGPLAVADGELTERRWRRIEYLLEGVQLVLELGERGLPVAQRVLRGICLRLDRPPPEHARTGDRVPP